MEYQRLKQARIINDVLPPTNFSWLVDRRLAVGDSPTTIESMNSLLKEDFDYLVASGRCSSIPSEITGRFRYVHLSPQSNIPTMDDCLNFLRLMERADSHNEKVFVYTDNKCETAMTLVACYFMMIFKIPADYAIWMIRNVRPMAIGDYRQEEVIHSVENELGEMLGKNHSLNMALATRSIID
ncbi:hypothetical protein SNEBB_006329 [Seison nebaliae]|nr:hypothetical protein SNEBB_006329 [Seison nebaliae]